ncbi:MAG: MATE family efflux transporter [Rhodospirillaceae bacterium]|nr:MATE family efflux transporter [Rhodospirillaceae bacterium]
MTKNWNRRTWRLAGPVMLSNVSVPLLGAVDMAVVGHLPGPQYLGAVAVGAMIFTIIFHSCNFLRMGTTGLTAQALGRDDPDEVRVWFLRAGLWSLAVGAAFIIFQAPISWAALKVIGPSAEVAPLAAEYYSIRILSAPASMANYALLGWFFGIQNARAALITQIFLNGLNIILDFWFVMGLGWGVAGVAWATVIGEYAAVGLGLILVVVNARRLGGQWDFRRVFRAQRLALMVRVNRDIFLRSMCLQITLATFTAIGARMGDVVLAVNAILLNMHMFMTYALDGFANATEALSGEALGQGNRKRFRAAIKATSRWALGFSVVLAAGFALGGPYLIDILSGDAAVREMARGYLIWAVIMPLVSVWSYQLDGVFIGATWTREMRNGMAISMIFFMASLMALIPVLGNHGLWLSFQVFMAVRGITLAVWFPRLERRIGAL